jgi:hypothetical protein
MDRMKMISGCPFPDAATPYVRRWSHQPRPKYFRRQLGPCCFKNAGLAVTGPKRSADHHYVEGWAGWGTEWFEHAWIVDSAGRVIDQTWRYHPNQIYFGVPFKRYWIAHTMQRQSVWKPSLWILEFDPDAQKHIAHDLLSFGAASENTTAE